MKTFMKTFREILGKPSSALQAMVDGLREYSGRKDFVVDMGSYGHVEGGICYGCAATCAVQKTLGLDYLSVGYSYPRSSKDLGSEQLLGVDSRDLCAFETAIDQARKGDLWELMGYFNVDSDVLDSVMLVDRSCTTKWDRRFDLEDNWREQLGVVEAVISEMKVLGL